MANESGHYAREKAFWDERGEHAYVSLSPHDLARLRRWVAWDGVGTCLDLGAGSGMGAMVLGAPREGGTIVGVDISHKLLRHAPTSAVQGDALRLPFRDAAFDVVIAAALFHHLPERHAELLAECARVLVPGGRIVGYDPSADCLQNRIFMGDSKMRLGTFSPDERPIRPATLATLAARAGLDGFRFERFTFRNAKLTAFELVQRYVLEPIAIGPLAPLFKRWFLWEARRAR